MSTNPILEEIWRIKDELAREAGNDLHQLCENTRRWAAKNPHAGPAPESAAELRELLAERERLEGMMVREEAADYEKKKP